MSRADAIQKKLNNILGKTNAFDRVVYLRRTMETGGDSLIGRPGSVAYEDMKLSPQPYTQRLGRERIPGGHATSETYQVSRKMKVGDDYSLIVSGSVVTVDILQDPSYQFVFKDSHGAEEVLIVYDYETVSFDGKNLAYMVYARSSAIQ